MGRAQILTITAALSEKTKVSRAFPIYDNAGKPDLTIDPQRFVSQMEIVDRCFVFESWNFIQNSP
jgi:hypothetical protein